MTYGSQKTQTRTYTYNSLGWLLSASNPEMSGAINYTYFANGALQTRGDAAASPSPTRSISSGASPVQNFGDIHDRYLSRGDGGPPCPPGGRTCLRSKQR